MQLIRRLEIRHFRSCRDVILQDIGDISSIVGQNNVGKSNILRALNLFFNGETDPGVRLERTEDRSRPLRGRANIEVAVEFMWPAVFGRRRGLQETARRLGIGPFGVRKVWTAASSEPRVLVRLTGRTDWKEDAALAEHARRFIGLIRFRLLPANREPLRLLIEWEPEITRRLAHRFRAPKAPVAPLWEQVRKKAQPLIADLSQRLGGRIPNVARLEIETPKDWTHLLLLLGYSYTTDSGRPEREAAWGTGLQNVLLFYLLSEADSWVGGEFGWRQGAVWALEEPEISLHRDLEYLTAEFLNQTSTKADSRLQVFVATHSDIFMETSGAGFLLDMRGGWTGVKRLETRALLASGAVAGVSPYQPPLLRDAYRPLVLVEGPTDARYLRHTAKLTGVALRGRILSLPELCGLPAGGVSGLAHFLEANCDSLHARREDAPVVVVCDWSVTAQEKTTLEKAVRAAKAARVWVMPEARANPQLGETFKGIERFLPTDLILRAEQRHGLKLSKPRTQSYPLDLAPQARLDDMKPKLVEMFEQETRREAASFLRPVLEEILRRCEPPPLRPAPRVARAGNAPSGP
jgi:hypothetical protein